MGPPAQKETPQAGAAEALRTDAAALQPRLPSPFQAGQPSQVDLNRGAEQIRKTSGFLKNTSLGLSRALPPATTGDIKELENRGNAAFGGHPEARTFLQKLAGYREQADAASREGRYDAESMGKAQRLGSALNAILDANNRTGSAAQQAAERGDETSRHAATEMKIRLPRLFRILSGETPESIERAHAAADVTIHAVENRDIYRHEGNKGLLSRVLQVQERLTNDQVQMSHDDIQRDMNEVSGNFYTAAVRALGPAGGAAAAMMAQVQSMMAFQTVRDMMRGEADKLEKQLKELLKVLGDPEKTDEEKKKALAEAEEAVQKFVLKALDALLKEIGAPPELASAIGKAAKFIGTARAGMLLQAGMMYVRYKEAFDEKKELLDKLVQNVKQLADEKFKPAAEKMKEIVGALQDIHREAAQLHQKIMQARMRMAAALGQALGELRKMAEKEASRPLREAMEKLGESLRDMLRRLQNPKTAKEVDGNKFKNALETFGWLKAMTNQLGKMPSDKPEQKKDKENAAQLVANAVKSSIRDARSEMSRMLQFVAGDYLKTADTAYKAALFSLGNALNEGKKTLDEAKKEVAGRLLQEGNALLSGLAKLGDARLIELVKGLLPGKEKPEQETMESIFKARQAIDMGSFALKEVAGQKAEHVKTTALGFVKGALGLLGKGNFADASALYATAQQYISSPETRNEIDKKLTGLRKAVQEFEKSPAAMRNTIDIGGALKESLRKLHLDAKSLGERLSSGELVSPEEVAAVEKRFKFAEQAIASLRAGAEGAVRKAAGEIFARGLDALASGNPAVAALHRFLGAECMKGNAAYRKQLEQWSAGVASGEMKMEDAVKQAASRLAGELGKIPAWKSLTESGITDSIKALIQRGSAPDATLADCENMRSALDLAGEYRAGIRKATDKAGLAKVFARAFAGLARGLSPEYVDAQAKLARSYMDPPASAFVKAEARRAQIEAVSARMEDVGLLNAVHGLFTREPPLDEATVKKGLEALFGTGPEGAAMAARYLQRYKELGPDAEAKGKAMAELAKVPNTYVKLLGAAQEMAKKRKETERQLDTLSFQYTRGITRMDKALAALAKGEKPADADLKAAEAARAVLLGSADDIAALFAASEEDLPRLRTQFAGVLNVGDAVKGRRDTREQILGIAASALEAIKDGDYDKVAAFVMGYSAYSKAQSEDDRGRILGVTEGLSAEAKKKYTPDQARWMLRLQFDRATALDKTRDAGAKKNLQAYFDMSLVLFERRDLAGAEMARMLAADYATASRMEKSDPTAKAAIELAHRILGDHRKDKGLDRRRVQDATRPEDDKRRWEPKSLDGIAGKALVSNTTLEEQLKAAEAGEKDKGTVLGEVLSLPAGQRMQALGIRMGGLSADLGKLEFERGNREVVPSGAAARRKIEAVYKTENAWHSARAAAAEKSGDATEAERQREEAGAVDPKWMESQLQRAAAIYGKGLALLKEAGGLRMRALTEEPGQAKKTNAEAAELSKRGLQIIQFAEAAQKSLKTHDESVRKIRHDNRDEGRWRLRDAAESFLKVGEEMAEAKSEKPDGRQTALLGSGARAMGKGMQEVETQKRLWETHLTNQSKIQQERKKAKANDNAYGNERVVKDQQSGVERKEPLKMSRDVTYKGKTYKKGTAVVDTEQRLKDLNYAEGASRKLRFRGAAHFLSKAQSGILLDQRRAATELNYQELLPGATAEEQKSGDFKPVEWPVTDASGNPTGKTKTVGFNYNDLMGTLLEANDTLSAGRVGEANRAMAGYEGRLNFAYQTQKKLNDIHRDERAMAELTRLAEDARKWGDMSPEDRADLKKRLDALAAKGIITSLGEKPYREVIEEEIKKRNDALKAQGKPPNFTAADYRKETDKALAYLEKKRQAGTLTKDEAASLDGIKKLRNVAEEMEKDPVGLAQRQQVADAIRRTGGPEALAKAGEALRGDVSKDKDKATAQLQDLVNNGPVSKVLGPQDVTQFLNAVFMARGWDPKYYSNLVQQGKAGQAWQEFMQKHPEAAIKAIEYMRDNGQLGADKNEAARIAAFTITDIQGGQIAKRTEGYARGHAIAMGTLTLSLETASAVDTQERMSGVGGGNGSWYIGLRGDAASILQFGLAACGSPETIADSIAKGEEIRLSGLQIKLREGGGITEPSEAWLRAGENQVNASGFLQERLGNFLNQIQKFSVGSPMSTSDIYARMEKMDPKDPPRFTHDSADNLASMITRGIFASGGLAYDKQTGDYVKTAFSMDEQEANRKLLYGDTATQKGGYFELMQRFFNVGFSFQSTWSYGYRKDLFNNIGTQAAKVNEKLDTIAQNRIYGAGTSKAELDTLVSDVMKSRDSNISAYDENVKSAKTWESVGRAVSGIGKLALAGVLIASGYGSAVGVGFGVEALHDLAENSRKAGGYQYLSPEHAAMGWAAVALSFGGAVLGEATAIANETIQITRAGTQQVITGTQMAVRGGQMTVTEANAIVNAAMSGTRVSWLTSTFATGGRTSTVLGYGMMGAGIGMAGYGMREAWHAYQMGESSLFEFIVSGPVGLAQAGVPVLGAKMLPTSRLIPNLWVSESFGAKFFRGSMLFLTGETKSAVDAAHFSGIRDQSFHEFRALPPEHRNAILAMERGMSRMMSPEEQLTAMRMLPLERKANGELVLGKAGEGIQTGPFDAAAQSGFIGQALARLEAAPRIEALNQAYAEFKATGKIDAERARQLGLGAGDLALFAKDGPLAGAKNAEEAAAMMSNLAISQTRMRQMDKAAADAPQGANAQSQERAKQLALGFRRFLRNQLDEATAKSLGIEKPQVDLFQRLSKMAPEDISSGIARQAEGETVQKTRMDTMREKADAARAVGVHREMAGSFSVEHVPGVGFYKKFGGRNYSDEHAGAAADVGAAAQALYTRSKKQPITRDAAAAELARLGEAGAKVPDAKIDATLKLLADARFLKAVDGGDKAGALQRALDISYDMPGLSVSKDAAAARVAPEAQSYIQNANYPLSGITRKGGEQAKRGQGLRAQAKENQARADALPSGHADKSRLEALARKQGLEADAHEANASALTLELTRRATALEKDAGNEARTEAKARRLDEQAVVARTDQVMEAMKLHLAGKLTEKEATRLGFPSLEEARSVLTEIDSNPATAAKKMAKFAAEDVQALAQQQRMKLAAGAERQAADAAFAPAPSKAAPAPRPGERAAEGVPAAKARLPARARTVPAETQQVIGNIIARFGEAGFALSREQKGDLARNVLRLRSGQLTLGEFWRRINEMMPPSALPESLRMQRPFPSFPEMGLTIQSPEALNFFVKITAEALPAAFKPDVAGGLPADASIQMGFVSLDLRRQNLLNAIASNPQLRVVGDINIYEYFTKVVRDVAPAVNPKLRAQGIDATVTSAAFGTSSDEAGFLIVARTAGDRERARAILGDTLSNNFKFEGSILDQMTKGSAMRPYIEEVFQTKGRVGSGAAFVELGAKDMAAIAKDPAGFIDRMRRISDARIGEGDWVRTQKGAPTDADLPATAMHFMSGKALGSDYMARNEKLKAEFTGKLEGINREIFGPGNEKVKAGDSVVVVTGELAVDRTSAAYANLRTLASKKGKMYGTVEEGRVGLSVSNMPSQASGDEFLFIHRAAAGYARDKFAKAHGIDPANIDVVQTGNGPDFYFRVKGKKLSSQEASELLGYYREGGKQHTAEGFDVSARGTLLTGDNITMDNFRNGIRYIKDGISHGDLRAPREGGLVEFNSIPKDYTTRDMRLNRAGQIMGMFFSSERLMAADSPMAAKLAEVAGKEFVETFRKFLEEGHITARTWEDVRSILENGIEVVRDGKRTTLDFPQGKEIARRLSGDDFLGWVGGRYKDVDVNDALAVIKTRREAEGKAPPVPKPSEKAAPGPQAREREAGIQRLMSERGMNRDQATKFVNDEAARPNAVPLRPEEHLGEEGFGGMPVDYQKRTITLPDGSTTTLAEAPRARLLRRIDNTEDSVGSTAGVWEAEIMVNGQPRRVAVKVFKDPYVREGQQRTAQHWNNLFEFVTGRPARGDQPATMGEAGNLSTIAGMTFRSSDGRELPVGPGFYKFVNVDGNIAIAMDLLPGMYISDMSPTQIREFVKPDTYTQIQKIGETLQAKGYGMHDFQFIVMFPPESAIPAGLTGAARRQFIENWRTTINGREVRAGDVVLMDAGGLYRAADEPMSTFSPIREAARARSSADHVLINDALSRTTADASAPQAARAQADLRVMESFMREVETMVSPDANMAEVTRRYMIKNNRADAAAARLERIRASDPARANAIEGAFRRFEKAAGLQEGAMLPVKMGEAAKPAEAKVPPAAKPQESREEISVSISLSETTPVAKVAPEAVVVDEKAASQNYKNAIDELARMTPDERKAKLEEIRRTDSELATSYQFTLLMPEGIRARIAQDYSRAMAERARIGRARAARAAMTPEQVSKQERALILGSEAERAAGRIPPAVEAMAKARGQKPADFQQDLANDHGIGGITATLDRMVPLDRIKVPKDTARPEVAEGHYRQIADLLLRGNLEGHIGALEGFGGARITGITHASGLSGLYIIEAQTPGGAKRRVLVKVEDQSPSVLGVNIARANGLVTSDIRAGFSYDTGVIDPATKRPVMQEFGILSDIHDFALGNETSITLADGRSVKANEGQMVRARMPDGKAEDVRVMGVAMMFDEVLVNPGAAVSDPKKAAAVQEFYRLLSTSEGRQRLFAAWNAYHEMSRRSLLMDRFSRNTAVMLVDRGAQHPASERYQILFQPIDMDGVGHRVGAKLDGTPRFDNFNGDFAKATADLMTKLVRFSAANMMAEVEGAPGVKRPLYEGGPLTMETLYADYLSDRASGGSRMAPETPAARKAVADNILAPHDGKPFGLGFDTSKPDKPKLGSIMESGGRPRIIERGDGRARMDAGEMVTIYEAAAKGQAEFAGRDAARIADIASIEAAKKKPGLKREELRALDARLAQHGANELELKLAGRLAANPEFGGADLQKRVRIAQDELAKLKAPAKPPPLPAAAKKAAETRALSPAEYKKAADEAKLAPNLRGFLDEHYAGGAKDAGVVENSIRIFGNRDGERSGIIGDFYGLMGAESMGGNAGKDRIAIGTAFDPVSGKITAFSNDPKDWGGTDRIYLHINMVTGRIESVMRQSGMNVVELTGPPQITGLKGLRVFEPRGGDVAKRLAEARAQAKAEQEAKVPPAPALGSADQLAKFAGRLGAQDTEARAQLERLPAAVKELVQKFRQEHEAAKGNAARQTELAERYSADILHEGEKSRIGKLYELSLKGEAPKDQLDARTLEALKDGVAAGRPVAIALDNALEMRAQAKAYAEMSGASKPLPGGWADASMVKLVRNAMAARKKDAPEVVALDVLRSVNALADAAGSGKEIDSKAARALGYRSVAEANAAVELARSWAKMGGTPGREELATAALAVRSMEAQTPLIKFADTTGYSRAEVPGDPPPFVGVKMRWGEVDFTVMVFKDRVVVESVYPESIIGQKAWPNDKAQVAAMRYLQERFRGALTKGLEPAMRAIPQAGAGIDAWRPAFKAVEKAAVDLTKAPPPLPAKAMTPLDVVGVFRTMDYTSAPAAAEAFRSMNAGDRQKVVSGLRELARPGERRIVELIAEAGKLEVRAGELEQAGKSAEAGAARSQAKTMRESAEFTRKNIAKWHERAGYFSELDAIAGAAGDHIASRYGVKRERLEAAYAGALTSAEGRKAVFDLLGIKLDALPDAEIRHDLYKGFDTLADDPYLNGMVFTGNLFRELEAAIPGGKVKSIKFQNGLVGAYQLTVEAPNGQRSRIFAKRQDLNPDRTGSHGSALLGLISPHVIVKSGDKADGAPLSFISPDGVSTGYGIMRDIRDFSGKVLIGGREVGLRVLSAESYFDIPLPAKSAEGKAARDIHMRDLMQDPTGMMEELGHFHTGAAIGGYYDRHELNAWRAVAKIEEAPAKARETAEFLRSRGFKVSQEQDGTYTVRGPAQIDIDTFGSYRAIVGGWKVIEGTVTPARASELEGQGFIIRQNGDGTYSWFEAGGGNEVTFKPMVGQFVSDLHRFFARFAYAMNEAEVRNARGQGRPPKLMAVEDVVRMAFGENMDGPFIKGMQRRLREMDPNTPQGREFVRRMQQDVMKPFDGKPSGMGSPLTGRLGHDFESNGIAWAGGAFNGELNTPITNKDGRATFRMRYEISANPTVSEAAGKRMAAALPDNVEVRLVRLDNLPRAVRKQVVEAVQGAEPQAQEFKTAAIGGRQYLVVRSIDSVPDSIGGIPLRDNSMSVMRSGDRVYTYDQKALAEALPQGKDAYVVPAQGLGRQQMRSLSKSGRVLELGLTGENRYVIFDNLDKVPKALREKAVQVTRDQNALRGDVGMGKKLGINYSELGAGRMLEEILKMDEGEWKGIWRGVRDGIVEEEGRQWALVFKPEAGKTAEPRADFLAGRVPGNFNDQQQKNMLPERYGGLPKKTEPPAPPPAPGPAAGPARKEPPPMPQFGPGGTKIIGGAPQKPAPPAAGPQKIAPADTAAVRPAVPPGRKTEPVPEPQGVKEPPPQLGPGGTKLIGGAQPAEQAKVIKPAPKPVDEAVRAKLLEQNKAAQRLAETPAELLQLLQKVAAGERGALDALGDHPAAAVIKDFAERRNVKRAAGLNSKKEWDAIASRDIPILARRLRDETVRIVKGISSAQKPPERTPPGEQ
ncbi:MAG: hypothetical protein AB1529_05015 [Candidatus Micrarchaeota archaeon]